MTAKAGPTPPLSENNNQDGDVQVKGPEADQGEAEQAPVPTPTGNDPTISGAQVRGTDATPGAITHPPSEPLVGCGPALGVGNRVPPPGTPTGPHIRPRENICVLDGQSLVAHNRAKPQTHDANHMFRWRESDSEERSGPDPAVK